MWADALAKQEQAELLLGDCSWGRGEEGTVWLPAFLGQGKGYSRGTNRVLPGHGVGGQKELG